MTIGPDRVRQISMNKSVVLSQVIDFFGRAFMAAVFVNALPGKLNDFSGTWATSVPVGCQNPSQVLSVCAIVVLAVGSILLVVGSNTRLDASLLLLFWFHTTFIFHTFRVDTGFAMKLALIVGLILSLTLSTGASVTTFRGLRTKAGIWLD